MTQVTDSERAHSPEELRLLVTQTRAHGMINESDAQMLAGVFDFHQKKARDVMRPRTEIVAIPATATQDEVWAVVRQERYSRYPVYGEDLDDLIGVFLAKDLWLYDGKQPFTVQQFVREALYIPDSRPAERVLDDLRKTRAHMAIVLDEFGGTAGIVTMEDLVEEVIGDIADEYDVAQREALEMNGVLELSGSMSLIDVRSDHGVKIPEGSWSTLGGYVFSKIGRVPRVGDRVPFSGGELEVVAMDSRRVAAVRVHRAPEPVAARENGGAAVSDALEVTDSVSIPRDELSIRASRSGGAGGQHVNTSSTRIELLWNVAQSRALPDDVRERVLERLRVAHERRGFVRIVSSEHRSQLRNREAAEERLAKLVRGALAIPRARTEDGADAREQGGAARGEEASLGDQEAARARGLRLGPR